MTKSIKSRQGLSDFGEVFISEREVKAMCNLEKDEACRIDAKDLEPACGDGNFFAELLNRKLSIVENRYGKNKQDAEMYSVRAGRRGLLLRSFYASQQGTDEDFQGPGSCRAAWFRYESHPALI